MARLLMENRRLFNENKVLKETLASVQYGGGEESAYYRGGGGGAVVYSEDGRKSKKKKLRSNRAILPQIPSMSASILKYINGADSSSTKSLHNQDQNSTEVLSSVSAGAARDRSRDRDYGSDGLRGNSYGDGGVEYHSSDEQDFSFEVVARVIIYE